PYWRGAHGCWRGAYGASVAGKGPLALGITGREPMALDVTGETKVASYKAALGLQCAGQGLVGADIALGDTRLGFSQA
ncbi:unnamed protein product, partial [Ilex paraguariensis]